MVTIFRKIYFVIALLNILQLTLSTDTCYIKDDIYGAESKEKQVEYITHQQMCPDVTTSCCTDRNYESMLTWWRDDGAVSMSQVWDSKIKAIFETFTYREKIVERVLEYANKLDQNESANVNCREQSKDIIMQDKSGAIKQAYKSFDAEAKKCWGYTIDFMRGIGCGVCQSTFEKYLTKEYFLINDSECQDYASSCKYYWKAYYTLYNYLGRFHRLAVCKNHEISHQVEYDNYFDSQYITQINQCMKDEDSSNAYCKEICTKEMPVLGITKREVVSFPQVRVWLRYIENTFAGINERKNYEDEVVNSWLTNKDYSLLNYFKEFAIRPHGILVTKFAKNTGLLLDNLGYRTVNELFDEKFSNATTLKYLLSSVLFITYQIVN